ncbi:MAG: alpha-1,2-fucosyltransferase [Bacteroidia bacterium]
MIIVKIYGGIGNQMFQYAAARRLAYKNTSELKLDITHYDTLVLPYGLPYRTFDLSIFNINLNIASEKEINSFKNESDSFFKKGINKIKNKISPHTFIYEPHYHFYPELLNKKGNIYIDGYWQSEKYFIDIKEILKEEFTILTTLNTEGLELLSQIKNTNSICLNIRRQEGSNRYSSSYFEEYINNSMNFMSSEISNPHFFIFSDDLNWVRENVKFNYQYTIVEKHLYGDKFRDCLFLMINCKHLIIPNSSFGWWAAWLNTNPDKIVVAPKKWALDTTINTQDLIPENWIRL